jgi:hypothetical protein
MNFKSQMESKKYLYVKIKLFTHPVIFFVKSNIKCSKKATFDSIIILHK